MSLIPTRRLVLWALGVAGVALAFSWLPGAVLLLLALNAVVVLAALLDWLLTPGPHRLEVLRLPPERTSVLTDTAVSIRVRNRSRMALHVRLEDSFPESFRAEAQQLAGVVAGEKERRFEYLIHPRKRGLFAWGPVHLRYRSPLGLWERQLVVEASAATRVYPNLAELYRYHLLARTNRLETLGIRKVRLRGGAWEFESLRDYARGDDVRLIDWKATARRRKLIIRNQEAERNQTVLLLIDSGRLMNAEQDGVAKVDHAVNTALMLSHVALGRGDRVGLCAFSHKVHSWVTPRPHRAQMRLITEALYDLRGDFLETDHGRCLRQLSFRHRKRALLVVLTDFVDAVTASDMIAHLQRASRQHLVLFVALNDPFLTRAAEGGTATVLQGFTKAAALDLLHERRRVLDRLRRSGMHVIDAEPGKITAPVLNEYLAIAFRGLL